MRYAQILDGKIVNIIEADAAFAASIGAVEVPDTFDIGDLYSDGTFSKAAIEIAVSEIDLLRERTRRLEAGFDYDFGDSRGVHHIGTSKYDMEGWNVVTTVANAALALGDDYKITIKTATGLAVVTAIEWQEVLLAASEFQQPIYQSYFALKAMDPIPSDFEDDAYWTEA